MRWMSGLIRLIGYWRSRARVPSTRASRTARPGSDAWPQSRKWLLRARLKRSRKFRRIRGEIIIKTMQNPC